MKSEQVSETQHDRDSAIERTISLGQDALLAPVNIAIRGLSTGFDLLRPYAPQIISALVFISLIPLVASISLYAGWAVWKRIAVGWETPIYLQYGDGRPPYAQFVLDNLATRQPYDVSVHFAVPSSHNNLALGNFMTTLTLSTTTNKTLTAVRVPSLIVPAKAGWLFGSSSALKLDIPLLKSFIPSSSSILVNLSVGRNDGWKSLGSGEGRELTVHSALLRGILVQKGFRGLITRFPLSFSILSTLVFFTVTMTVTGMCLLPLALTSGTTIAERGQVGIRSTPSEPYRPKVGEETRRRRSRGSRSSSGRRSIKNEVPETVLMSEDSPELPLRRRRSGLAERLSDSD